MADVAALGGGDCVMVCAPRCPACGAPLYAP